MGRSITVFKRRKTHRLPENVDYLSYLFSVLFVGGCLCSVFVLGAFDDFDAIMGLLSEHDTYDVSVDFIYLFVRAMLYHVLLLFCSTSYIGLFFVPFIFLVNGFDFGILASSSFSIYPGGITALILCVGIPTAITLPSLFMLGRASFSCSLRLFNLQRRRSVSGSYVTLTPLIVLSFACVFVSALFQYFVVAKLYAFY